MIGTTTCIDSNNSCCTRHFGRNVTSAGWQVTLCDPIWHVSSRSGVVLVAQTAIRFLTLPYHVLSMGGPHVSQTSAR